MNNGERNMRVIIPHSAFIICPEIVYG
jgi:hypothetical protein